MDLFQQLLVIGLTAIVTAWVTLLTSGYFIDGRRPEPLAKTTESEPAPVFPSAHPVYDVVAANRPEMPHDDRY